MNLTLPWFIRASFASKGSFRTHLGFLSMRTALLEIWLVSFMHALILCEDVWLIRFMHGIMRNGLLGYAAYQVHARNYEKWLIGV